MVQQLAHLGFRDFVLFDPKDMEAKHLHRFVGATQQDVEKRTPKVEIGRRIILGVRPDANVVAVREDWQKEPSRLWCCDIVFGCVDTYQARHELEAECRRYLIPYIDIGMDVFPPAQDFGHRMVGQVVLSMPGRTCMYCMGFLRDELHSREAQAYGSAGGEPQVVFANALLASAAVAHAVDLVTSWSGSQPCTFLRLDGNALVLAPDSCADRWNGAKCSHYRLEEVGPPLPRGMIRPRQPQGRPSTDNRLAAPQDQPEEGTSSRVDGTQGYGRLRPRV